MPRTFTHVGYRAHVGYRHYGAKLWGHHEPKPGRRHALNGGPDVFTALCGEAVSADRYDEFGFLREGGAKNVWPVGTPGSCSVTCKRCLRLASSTPE